MKLNKEQFLKSEFGSELEGVIKAWSRVPDLRYRRIRTPQEEAKEWRGEIRATGSIQATRY